METNRNMAVSYKVAMETGHNIIDWLYRQDLEISYGSDDMLGVYAVQEKREGIDKEPDRNEIVFMLTLGQAISLKDFLECAIKRMSYNKEHNSKKRK